MMKKCRQWLLNSKWNRCLCKNDEGRQTKDEGIAFGLHGRVHHIPARHVSANGRWLNDEYEMTISGLVEETAIFGENIRLTRTIKSWLGKNRIQVVDEVENAGFMETPLMLLYHCNFGAPFLDAGAKLVTAARVVAPRDEGAVEGLGDRP